ncbi:MAG: thiamine pyrophosphate-dependent enzyme [Paracoccaceae bacterium]
MIRSDVLGSLVPHLGDTLAVCNIGAPSQELHALAERNGNFYMLGTMGLCTPIALGLALARPARAVLAIEGDGALLTNLGTLATLANNVADNLVVLVIDNASYGSTGDQPTYSGARTSLGAVARGCGCENVVECGADEAADSLRAAQVSARMTVIIAKCAPGNADVPVIRENPVVMRTRFMAEVAKG